MSKLFILFIFVYGSLSAQNTFNITIEYSCVDINEINGSMLEYAPSKIYMAIYNNNVAQWFDGGLFHWQQHKS